MHSCLHPTNEMLPLILGGDSEAAARRAGRLGDGYFPFGTDLDQPAHLVRVLRRVADDAGWDFGSIELSALGSKKREHVAAVSDPSFTRIALFLPQPSVDSVERLRDEIEPVIADLPG